MIIKKGKIKIHHFAHKNIICTPESYLHKAAKEILGNQLKSSNSFELNILFEKRIELNYLDDIGGLFNYLEEKTKKNNFVRDLKFKEIALDYYFDLKSINENNEDWNKILLYLIEIFIDFSKFFSMKYINTNKDKENIVNLFQNIRIEYINYVDSYLKKIYYR